MLKKLFNLIKKIVFVCFLLYGYNIIAAPLDLIIPINFINIGIITILGMPALFALILIHVLIF